MFWCPVSVVQPTEKRKAPTGHLQAEGKAIRKLRQPATPVALSHTRLAGPAIAPAGR